MGYALYSGDSHMSWLRYAAVHRWHAARIAGVLGKHNILLAVGFHAAAARREGRQYQFIQEADALSLLLKSVAVDNVGMWFDTWDWYVGGGTVESLKAFGVDKVAYVTIADAPSDVDRSSLTEDQRIMPVNAGESANTDGPVKAGAASVQGIMTLLNEEGYNGPVTLAPNAACFTGMKNDDILKQCQTTLEELYKATEGDKNLVAAGAEE